MLHRLTRDFYLQDTLTAARALIGCFLVHETEAGRIVGRINETEAYIGAIDKACHAYQGRRTPRTETLFAQGGTVYVYLIYGMYHCLNVVTEAADVPCAVLLRGCALVEGLDLAAQGRFGTAYTELTESRQKTLANGPGKLCMAFGVDRAQNNTCFLDGALTICDRVGPHVRETGAITASKRIGIDYAQEAADFLWRFTG